MDVLEIALDEVRDNAEDNPNVTVTENGHYICE